MSTKIYNGWRVPFNQIPEFVPRANSTLYAKYEELYLDLFTLVANNLIDKNKDQLLTYEEREEDESYLRVLDAVNGIIKQEQRRILDSGRRAPLFDLQCSYTVIFSGTDYAYLLLHTDRREYEEAWETLEAEYWGYWNNSDPPKNISYEEFKARGDKWKEITQDFKPPSLCGVTFEVLDAEFFPPINILNYSKVEEHGKTIDMPEVTTERLQLFVATRITQM